jgi:hypothetical protein
VGAQGLTTIDFGAFPGTSDASVFVSQPTISSGSLVEAWLYPDSSGSVDHSADEHKIETIKIVAGNIVVSSGFTVYGFNTSQISEPLTQINPGQTIMNSSQFPFVGGITTRIYGKWTVAWVWN